MVQYRKVAYIHGLQYRKGKYIQKLQHKQVVYLLDFDWYRLSTCTSWLQDSGTCQLQDSGTCQLEVVGTDWYRFVVVYLTMIVWHWFHHLTYILG
jgi:hypothetical protein